MLFAAPLLLLGVHCYKAVEYNTLIVIEYAPVFRPNIVNFLPGPADIAPHPVRPACGGAHHERGQGLVQAGPSLSACWRWQKSHPASMGPYYGRHWSDDYLVSTVDVDSIFDLQKFRADFSGDYAFKGYPLGKELGNMIYPAPPRLAIMSTSEHKEAAWSFVRQMFTEEYQSKYRHWITRYPTNAGVFENYLEDAMTPVYEYDGEGNRKEIPRSEHYGVEIYAAGEEDRRKFLELIESCDRLACADVAVYNIICQECGALFAGDKTPEETARLIQDRVSLYINEQR